MLGASGLLLAGFAIFGGGGHPGSEEAPSAVAEPDRGPRQFPVRPDPLLLRGIPPVLVNSPDSDGDGIPDDWEETFGLDPNNPGDAESDFDMDWLTALQEFQNNSSPLGWAIEDLGLTGGAELAIRSIYLDDAGMQRASRIRQITTDFLGTNRAGSQSQIGWEMPVRGMNASGTVVGVKSGATPQRSTHGIKPAGWRMLICRQSRVDRGTPIPITITRLAVRLVGLSDSGAIAGWADATGYCWYGGTLTYFILDGATPLIISPPDGNVESLKGMNGFGEVVGLYRRSGYYYSVPFVSDGVNFTPLEELANLSAQGYHFYNHPLCLGDSGAVAGAPTYGANRGFFLKDGILTWIDPPGGGVFYPKAIGGGDLVVGEIVNPDGTREGYAWRDGAGARLSAIALVRQLRMDLFGPRL
ncbi:MAG: thrombospondin type 3 repeat-containing protein [Verrucomicrobiales bacterium]